MGTCTIRVIVDMATFFCQETQHLWKESPVSEILSSDCTDGDKQFSRREMLTTNTLLIAQIKLIVLSNNPHCNENANRLLRGPEVETCGRTQTNVYPANVCAKQQRTREREREHFGFRSDANRRLRPQNLPRIQPGRWDTDSLLMTDS